MKKINWWSPDFSKNKSSLLKKVLSSNFVNEGKYSQKFENEISKLLNVRFCSLTTSGTIAIFLALVSSAVLGFMVFNFPFGRIFLGDGGAYVLGHLLVWSAILLINHDPSISSFAVLLIFFWPVADTVLAIWRRLKLGNPTDRPDRLHFHHVAMRFIEIRFFGRDRRNIANPLATVILIPFISVPQIIGIYFWADFTTTVWCSIFMGMLVVVTYVVGISLAKKPSSI